jgi:hypothetical protein
MIMSRTRSLLAVAAGAALVATSLLGGTAANAVTVTTGAKSCPSLWLATTKATTALATGHYHTRSSDGALLKSEFTQNSFFTVSYRAFTQNVSASHISGQGVQLNPGDNGISCTH